MQKLEKSARFLSSVRVFLIRFSSQRALDVLCARPDVDARRVGCAGLSGGGMRTVFLGWVGRSHSLRRGGRIHDHVARIPDG